MFQEYSGEPSELPELPLTGYQPAHVGPQAKIRNFAFPRSNKLSLDTTVLLAISVLISLALAMPAAAQRETVLYSFGSGGITPYAGLLLDSAGNLYGTTAAGGANDAGTVFELTRAASGGWTETTLHSFTGADGDFPIASLLMDSVGNLYSTTADGGAYGAGTVFELTRSANGTWTETVLRSFNGSDGATPLSSLIFDGEGNLYGASNSGGISNFGAVFELRPSTSGSWTENLLYSFRHGLQSGGPYGGLVFDSSGNLYGTTFQGGGYADGIVFELVQNAGGGWMEKVLHIFNYSDGVGPSSSLIFDSFSNLYGTTEGGGGTACGTTEIGGIRGCGVVFELKPQSGGGWTEQVLHRFGSGTDGAYPKGSLVMDATGNLYGTSAGGGAYNGGTVFQLIPLTDGLWTEKILYSFTGGADGFLPQGAVIFDAAGNLYGTTYGGGAYGNGTVFEITQ
jgi:uncharacterized repeat protein (TIGR03803 family)